MVYVMLGGNFTIVEILSEKKYKEKYPGKRNVRKDTEISSSGSCYYYVFYDLMDAKINIALAQVQYFERKIKTNNEIDLKVWFGDSYLSIEKTKKWLFGKERKFPEYFI